MLPDDGRVVSNFIVQAIKGEDLTIYGDGKQTCSFCYVDELIDGLIKLMNHPNFIGPVNIGNPGEFTMLELADRIIQKTNTSSRISMHPLPGDDPLQRKPDISIAKEQLNWEPKIALSEGLDKTIEYFRKRINGN